MNTHEQPPFALGIDLKGWPTRIPFQEIGFAHDGRPVSWLFVKEVKVANQPLVGIIGVEIGITRGIHEDHSINRVFPAAEGSVIAFATMNEIACEPLLLMHFAPMPVARVDDCDGGFGW